jgi:hypothetical protein
MPLAIVEAQTINLVTLGFSPPLERTTALFLIIFLLPIF